MGRITQDEKMSILGHLIASLLKKAGYSGEYVLLYEVDGQAFSSLTTFDPEARRALLQAALDLEPEQSHDMSNMDPTELLERLNAREH